MVGRVGWAVYSARRSAWWRSLTDPARAWVLENGSTQSRSCCQGCSFQVVGAPATVVPCSIRASRPSMLRRDQPSTTASHSQSAAPCASPALPCCRSHLEQPAVPLKHALQQLAVHRPQLLQGERLAGDDVVRQHLRTPARQGGLTDSLDAGRAGFPREYGRAWPSRSPSSGDGHADVTAREEPGAAQARGGRYLRQQRRVGQGILDDGVLKGRVQRGKDGARPVAVCRRVERRAGRGGRVSTGGPAGTAGRHTGITGSA